MSRLPIPGLLLVAALLLPAVAQAQISVFGGHEGNRYQGYLTELLTTVDAGPLVQPDTAGSQENLLRLRTTPNSIALVQADVLLQTDELGGADVRVLARAFEEAVWVAAPLGIESLDGLTELDVGPSTSGAAFTLQRLASAWTGLPPLEGGPRALHLV